MKNITVTVADDLYHRAKVKAAERRTTVTAMVRTYLEGLSTEESDFDRRQREQNALLAQMRTQHPGFRAASRLSRDEVHRR